LEDIFLPKSIFLYILFKIRNKKEIKRLELLLQSKFFTIHNLLFTISSGNNRPMPPERRKRMKAHSTASPAQTTTPTVPNPKGPCHLNEERE
jgi:hypothetical protein